jgi:hypothetical protein
MSLGSHYSHTGHLLLPGICRTFLSDPHLLNSAERMRVPHRLWREVSHLLIRLRGYSMRRHSIKSSIFVQRNHGIIGGCVGQTGKEAHSVCLASKLLAAATRHHLVGEGCTKESAVVPRMITTTYLLHRGEAPSQSSHSCAHEAQHGSRDRWDRACEPIPPHCLPS